MKIYNIAVIPGDGIGPEVVNEGVKILKVIEESMAAFKLSLKFFDWGSEYYLKNGIMMPQDGIKILSGFDAIYLGAVGDPRIKDHITLHGLLFPIRRCFDQYANVRPAYLFEGIKSPLEGVKAGEIDMVVIRENTEGEYADVGGRMYSSTLHEVAIQSNIFTRYGTERIIRYAFEIARKRKKKMKVTSITKSNAMKYGMVFWDEIFQVVAKDYPDISTESMLIDAACMNFVRKPGSFDTVVASNLFGDILSDLSAMIVGGMGMAPGANINPEKTFPAMFEPVHGSAPDIAGKGIANPVACIYTAQMMLDYIGEEKAANLLTEAIKINLKENKIKTVDLGGSSHTSDVGNDITRIIRTLCK